MPHMPMLVSAAHSQSLVLPRDTGSVRIALENVTPRRRIVGHPFLWGLLIAVTATLAWLAA